MVYKNFEKNYKTYRTTWSGEADAFQPELDAATIAAATTFVAAATTTTTATTTKAKQ